MPNLILKCGFLIIHLSVQLGKQEHFMVNCILVCRQGISTGVGVLQQRLSWIPLSCSFFLRGFLMDCVLWCMLVRVSVYLQIISLSLKVVKSIRSATSAN